MDGLNGGLMDSVMDGFYDQSMDLYGRQYEPKKFELLISTSNYQ